jgi:transposase
MEEVEGEPLFCERAAGIDIGKQSVFVTIRVPSEAREGGRRQETREFGTTRRQLLALADWLRCWGVEKAGMEATSDYWKPVCFLLERERFDCLLYQASQVKALPGRPKTDKLDSAWLATVTEQGSLAGSFVPPEEIRRLRTHTRYRRRLTQARTAEKARCEKLLEDAHLKLSSVISDIHGLSGRAMLRAIISGERRPKVLAEMALGRMRPKIARLEEALDGSSFTPEHAFILEMMLGNIDHYTAQIAVLDERIAVLCEPYERQVEQLDGVPGFGVTAAQDLIAEIGTDMSAFPTAGHLCSWARVAPRAGIGQAHGQERHRPRQPLHRRHPRRDRRQRRPHPDLPQRQAPPPVPAYAEEEGPGRHHAKPARHRPRPPVRPPGRVPGPRPRLLRAKSRHPPPGPQSHPRHRAPRLQGHHPGHQPRHRRAPGSRQLNHPPPLPRARQRWRAVGRCRLPS